MADQTERTSERSRELTPFEAAGLPPVEAAKPAAAPPAEPGAFGFRLRWLLAAVGAFFSVLGIQFGSVFVGSIAVVVAFLATGHDPFDADAFMGPLALAAQLVTLAVFYPWWRHLRETSALAARRSRGSHAVRILAVAMIGLGMQLVIAYALTFILPLFPALETDYAEVMDSPVLNGLTVLSMVVVAIGAPVTEELACRGVMLEFAIRAFCPQHVPVPRRQTFEEAGAPAASHAPVAPRVAVSARCFWTANVLQALLFGILHMNIVQGCYAFGIGLLLGWVAWRTGSVRASIGVHLVINFSSFFVEPVTALLGSFGTVQAVVLSAALLAGGIRLFATHTQPVAAEGELLIR